MRRLVRVTLSALTLLCAAAGCHQRLMEEGVGAVLGAQGASVDLRVPADLNRYRGMKIDSITTAPGLVAPQELPDLVRRQYETAAQLRNMPPDGTPCLLVRGEIIHYEPGTAVDQVIGPFQELIVRTAFHDAETDELVGAAQMIGRSKSTTSGGPAGLAGGTGKALVAWLLKSSVLGGGTDDALASSKIPTPDPAALPGTTAPPGRLAAGPSTGDAADAPGDRRPTGIAGGAPAGEPLVDSAAPMKEAAQAADAPRSAPIEYQTITGADSGSAPPIQAESAAAGNAASAMQPIR